MRMRVVYCHLLACDVGHGSDGFPRAMRAHLWRVQQKALLAAVLWVLVRPYGCLGGGGAVQRSAHSSICSIITGARVAISTAAVCTSHWSAGCGRCAF